ncbi:MAG: hypothetical protein JXO22_05995, partial [Phycisphaerae bacterium]|nr:hypothetical protein [Phycisphaerae bacterium]
PAILDLKLRGPSLAMVMDVIRDFGADVVISDAEAWTNMAGRRLGIPRIAFDHFGILVHCQPRVSSLDRLLLQRERMAYLMLMERPQRVIVSSFYDAPPRRAGVRVVGPLLRDDVCKMRSSVGEHVLVYLNNGAYQFTPWVEQALRKAGCPMKVYGTQRIGTLDNLEFCPPAGQAFIEDLAKCRAVISTAGNQLVGEAMHFGKPMLVMPETCVEQRCNANAVEQMGIGVPVEHRALRARVIGDFLAREDEFRENIRRAARDGRAEAIDALETYLAELAGRKGMPGYIRKVS